MKVIGYTVRNMKNGLCLGDSGFFEVNRCAAEYAKLYKTYAQAEAVSNAYRNKDIPTIVIEVTKE